MFSIILEYLLIAMQHTHHRTIRSYVLRQGRLTTGQAKALEQHWQTFGIEYQDGLVNFTTIFNRNAPIILDIGAGMGETLVSLAETNPANDYLATEVHRPGVGSLIKNAVDRGLGNVRVINHDIVEALKTMIPDRSLDAVYINFPDPWPKKRHHKRRLVNPGFLDLLKPKMKTNACLYLATDWEDLAGHMLNVCDNDAGLINLAGIGHFIPRPAWRPQTKFESRGLRLEHKLWDLCYCLARSG